jgi:hypothetical protein
MLLLGEVEDAEEESRKLLQALRDTIDGPFWNHEALLKYLEGDFDENDVLKNAGASRISLCRANYQIAMKAAGLGDRETATRHFLACISAGQFNLPEYYWSQAFLARMQYDETWPDRLAHGHAEE